MKPSSPSFESSQIEADLRCEQMYDEKKRQTVLVQLNKLTHHYLKAQFQYYNLVNGYIMENYRKNGIPTSLSRNVAFEPVDLHTATLSEASTSCISNSSPRPRQSQDLYECRSGRRTKRRNYSELVDIAEVEIDKSTKDALEIGYSANSKKLKFDDEFAFLEEAPSTLEKKAEKGKRISVEHEVEQQNECVICNQPVPFGKDYNEHLDECLKKS